tara:strand:- start:85 stop:675 length:591 start_codon:yes stop_codon:yes gene_type:complete
MVAYFLGALILNQGLNRTSLLTEQILTECDLLETPYGDHHERLLSHIIDDLEFLEIPRWAEAEAHGMLALHCHDNALDCEMTDPHGVTKAVHGWWRNGHGFVFHSVVAHHGQLTCVTPVIASPWDDTSSLLFAPDPWVRRGSLDGFPALLIDGKDVPQRLSLNPSYDLKLAAEMRWRLANGFDADSVAKDPILINV